MSQQQQEQITDNDTKEAARIRYDRQIRLWGSGVQKRLQTTILIVSPSLAFDETIKNLVLAGVGRIRILPFSSSNNKKTEKTEKILTKSVVALCGAETKQINEENKKNFSSSPIFSSVEEAFVAGLKQLNNLVDAKIYDPSETFSKEDSSCIMALLDEGKQEEELLKNNNNNNIDIICEMKFVTEHFAMCEFITTSTTSAQQQKISISNEDSATSSSSKKLGIFSEKWKINSSLPPLAALLHSASAASSSSSSSSFSPKKKDSFACLMKHLITSEPEAIQACDPKVVEKVASEFLLLKSTTDDNDETPILLLPSTVLNSIFGGVLSQQVVAHACVARGVEVVSQTSSGSSSAQPKPVQWLYVTTEPQIEVIVS